MRDVIARWKPSNQNRSDMSGLRPAANRIWRTFRHSRLVTKLRQIGVVSLMLELRATLREPLTSGPRAVSRDFARNKDPWNYETNPTERRRFQDQTKLLDAVPNAGVFRAGLEIGCAAGLYTEVLAQRCESLLVLDISPVALELARQRRKWSNCVKFKSFDLRMDEIPGTFDLIVLAGVLEYFNRPGTLFRVREKLIGALKPGGYLLVETTRRPVLENTWWGRRLIRGRWINQFISQHPALSAVTVLDTEYYAIALCHKAGPKPIQ